MKTTTLAIVILVVLLNASLSSSATKNSWVEGQTLPNGVYRNGHFRIYDYLSYKYSNNTSFWTATGEYSQQNRGVDKEPYYQGTLRPEARELMDEIVKKREPTTGLQQQGLGKIP